MTEEQYKKYLEKEKILKEKYGYIIHFVQDDKTGIINAHTHGLNDKGIPEISMMIDYSLACDRSINIGNVIHAYVNRLTGAIPTTIHPGGDSFHCGGETYITKFTYLDDNGNVDFDNKNIVNRIILIDSSIGKDEKYYDKRYTTQWTLDDEKAYTEIVRGLYGTTDQQS